MNVITDPVTVAGDLRPVLLKIARRLGREVHDLGVTGGQVALLYEIAKNPGIGISELAGREGVSAPRMSNAVARLVDKDLAVSSRGDDRRRVGVSITDEGRAILQKVRRRRTAWLAERLQRLEPDELEAIEAAAPALARLLEPQP